MGPASIAPRIPVADEEFVVELSRHLALLPLGQLLHGLFQGGAGGKDLKGEKKPLPFGGEEEALHVQREIRNLNGLPSVDRNGPNLGGAGTGGEEVDGLAVRRPEGGVVGRLMAREATGRLPGGISQPEVGSSPVGFHIGGAKDKNDPLSIRRDEGFADSLHGQKIVHCEGMTLLGLQGGNPQPEEKGESQEGH